LVWAFFLAGRYEIIMRRSADEGTGRVVVGGIAQGDRWKDPRGDEYVVSWVRKLGVLGYRKVNDGPEAENVMDMTKFVQLFRPTPM
jgi:hypothetical protein